MLTRLQVWAQLAHAANSLPQTSSVQRAKWDTYYEALTLLSPTPLVLLSKQQPWGRMIHPDLGDPSKIPGGVKG